MLFVIHECSEELSAVVANRRAVVCGMISRSPGRAPHISASGTRSTTDPELDPWYANSKIVSMMRILELKGLLRFTFTR